MHDSKPAFPIRAPFGSRMCHCLQAVHFDALSFSTVVSTRAAEDGSLWMRRFTYVPKTNIEELTVCLYFPWPSAKSPLIKNMTE